MTRSRYTFEEALNRILRTLEGKALTTDTPEVVTGELLNKENAASDLSELLDNSLPGETLTIPTALINAVNSNLPAATTSVAGVAQLADSGEANDGVSTNTILTPQGHSWAHEYTEIYTNTGSCIQSFGAGAWTQITGSFQNKANDSGEFDWSSEEISVNEAGTYFVFYNIALMNHGTASKVRARAYFNGAANPESETVRTLLASGSITGIEGFGLGVISADAQKVDLRVKFDDANDATIESISLMLQKAIGG